MWGTDGRTEMTKLYTHFCFATRVKKSSYLYLNANPPCYLNLNSLLLYTSFKMHNSFSNLTNLKELYLSNYLISHLPAEVFSRNKFLRRIELQNNKIVTIDSNAFKNLTEISRLELNNN